METNCTTTHICMNCHKRYKGNYCPNCGQSAKVCRITKKMFFRWLASVYTCFDTKAGRTLRELVVRPGYLITQYIEGHRVPYMNPYQLLFFICAIYSFVVLIVDFPERELPLNIKFNLTSDLAIDIYRNFLRYTTIDACVDKINSVINYVMDNVSVFSLLTMPLAALAMQGAFRSHHSKAYPFNYMELLCARAFVSCLIALVGLALIPFKYNDMYMFFDPLVSYYVYRQMYRGAFPGGEWSVLGRSVLYMGLLFAGIIAVLAVVVVVLVMVPVVLYVLQ